MADNIFADIGQEPFALSEEWFPLLADNVNCAPGVNIPSFSTYRRVRVAAMFFLVRKRARRRDLTIETPIGVDEFEPGGRVTLVGRARHWFRSDPA